MKSPLTLFALLALPTVILAGLTFAVIGPGGPPSRAGSAATQPGPVPPTHAELAAPPALTAQNEACALPSLPVGALPPAFPIWCQPKATTGPTTFVQTNNSWVDDFDHELSNADMGTGYKVFDTQERIYKTQHFRHKRGPDHGRLR